MLLNRYDRKEKIVDEYLKNFFELPTLPAEPSAIHLINMVNKTNQLIRALPSFGIDVKSWDSWLTYSLKSKLDTHTFKKWLHQAKRREKITLAEFLEFIENEASENIGMPNKHQCNTSINTKQKPKSKPKLSCTTMMVSQNEPFPSCQECGSNQHAIFRCPAFKSKDVNGRLRTVQGTNLCRLCLRIHGETECTFSPCPHCDKNHNSLLCFKKEKEYKKKSNSKPSTGSTSEQFNLPPQGEKFNDQK